MHSICDYGGRLCSPQTVRFAALKTLVSRYLSKTIEKGLHTVIVGVLPALARTCTQGAPRAVH